MTSTPLKRDIIAAFADNTYPGDDRLTRGGPAGREYDETFQLLRGRNWRDMPVVEFIRGDTPIPDLTPEAFHYYMPALLLASIDGNSDVFYSLVFYLSPSSALNTGEFPYDDTDHYNRLMSLFSEEQRSVICRVLEEYVARDWETQEFIQPVIAILRREERR